jgi:raffinose/stachyose/melibiose transport system permease protein
MLPTYLLVLVFAYQPAVSALYHSFYWWNGIKQYWVGLANFVEFVKDQYFYNSVLNMVKLTAFELATRLTIPLLVATMIFRVRNKRVAYWYQVLMVIPMVVPGIVSMLIWRWFFSYDGLINIVLKALGQADAVRAWFGETSVALYALMFVGFPWAGGLAMLIYLAGLQQIPLETVEAAIIDGVGTFSRFFYIELPLVLGQVKLLLILNLIGGIQQFILPLVMTGGGPGWATMVPGLRMYFVLTNEFRYGYASAIGVALFLVILVLTYINQRYLRSSTEYEPT